MVCKTVVVKRNTRGDTERHGGKYRGGRQSILLFGSGCLKIFDSLKVSTVQKRPVSIDGNFKKGED